MNKEKIKKQRKIKMKEKIKRKYKNEKQRKIISRNFDFKMDSREPEPLSIAKMVIRRQLRWYGTLPYINLIYWS